MAIASNYRKKKGDGSVLIAVLECVAAVCGIVCLVLSSISGADPALVLLPFGYLMFLLVLGHDNIVRWAPGIAVLNIVLFARFVFVPFTMCLTGETSVYILNKANLPFGVPLMLYELLGIGLVLKLTAKKQRSIAVSGSPSTESDIRNGGLVAFAALLVMAVLAYRYRYLISGFSLITQGSVEGYTNDDLASGFVVSIWDALLAWLYVWVLTVTKSHARSEKLSATLCVVETFVFLLMVYIGQVTISRWQTVMAYAAGLFCLLCLFPKRRRGLLLAVTVPVLVLIFTASAFKNSDYSWAHITFQQAAGQLFDVSTFDIYLAGPSTISDGVTVYQHMGPFNLVAFFVDLVQNLPFINHWVDKSLSTVYVFHQLWGRGDLIMPLVGQSMVYFGWPFAPAMSMLSVWFVRFFDRLSYRAPSLPHVFISGFSGAWFGIATVLNLTITMSWVGLRIIPFYLLIMLTGLLGRRDEAAKARKRNDGRYGARVDPSHTTGNHLTRKGESL